jgi:hypothetical protein
MKLELRSAQMIIQFLQAEYSLTFLLAPQIDMILFLTYKNRQRLLTHPTTRKQHL